MASAAPAIAVAVARRRLVASFTEAGATSEAGAVAFAEPSRRLQRKVLERLVRNGVVQATADGRFWLDEEKLAASDRRRRRLAFRLVGGVAAVAAVAAGIAFASL